MSELGIRIYSDLDLDFTANPITGDVLKKIDDSAIAASIFNLLNTSHYERLFNPDLGCNLKKYLFEPIDDVTTSNIQEEIRRTIQNFEPRVELLDLVVNPYPDDNGYDVSIKVIVKNSTAPITISFFLERVR